MTFAQNVTLNGKATTDYHFDSKKQILTLMPEPIEPGKTVKFTFDIRINDNMEGKKFTNVAVLNDGGEETEVPSVPVEVPIEQAKVNVTKKASVTEATDLDVFRYTVTIHNDTNSVVWKNATATDFLPKELSLVGGPYINGQLDPDYYKSGNSIGVDLVEVEPGETIEIAYDVQVRKGTQKTVRYNEGEDQKVVDKMIHDNTITLTNIVIASGDNGSKSAEDSSVKVPPIVEVIPEEGGDIEPPIINPLTPTIKKDTEKTVVDVTKDPNNYYTITLENPAEATEVWKNVRVEDELITLKAHLYEDTVTVNGVPYKFNKDYTYTAGKDTKEYKDTMMIPVGDIKPGEKVVIKFQVRFSSDAVKDDPEFYNTAVAYSDNYKKIAAEAPTVVRTNPTSMTDIHHKIITGCTTGAEWEWWPRYSTKEQHKMLGLQEATAIIGRVLTADKRGEVWNGYDLNDSMKDLAEYDAINEWDAPPVRFMMFSGAITTKDFDVRQLDEGTDYFKYLEMYRIVATRNQIGKMLKSVGLNGVPSKDYSNDDPAVKTHRYDFADEITTITRRDQKPEIGSCRVNTFPDFSHDIVNETSTYHNYVLSANGADEIWTISDPAQGTPC